MKRIMVIGSLNMDLITQTDRVPRMGETLSGRSFRTACGGKGGNQAFAAARLGGCVSMFGCVGADMFGTQLISSLEGQGVDCGGIRTCQNTESGTASITVCQGDNCIIIIPGANAMVTVEYVKEHLEEIRTADIILLQLEIPLETVRYIIEFAKEEDIPVMINPAPAAELPDGVLEQTSYIIVNETECEFYTGIPVETAEDAKKGLKKMRQMGIPNGIVTLGEKGCVYNDGDELLYEPAIKVQAVDSTAAGDTFAAAVAVALMEDRPMQDAVRFATRASSIVVTRMGAQTSIPERREVEEIETVS